MTPHAGDSSRTLIDRNSSAAAAPVTLVALS